MCDLKHLLEMHLGREGIMQWKLLKSSDRLTDSCLATDSPLVGPAVLDIWATSNAFSHKYDVGTKASSNAVFILLL